MSGMRQETVSNKGMSGVEICIYIEQWSTPFTVLLAFNLSAAL